MSNNGRQTAIIVLDDENTSSDAENKTSLNGPRKRKADEDEEGEVEVEEKVRWTDDSDCPPVNPKKKRRANRKSAVKKGETSDAHGDRSKETRNEDDELKEAGIPDYLQDRRRAFNAKKQQNHDAALMFPPDYTDIELDDAGQLGRPLEERPQFDAASGVKPSRPYKDIELPHSGGLIPAAVAQYLRDYQVVGVEFLHRKFVLQQGGILGDDMGLGKTVQVAAFLAAAFGKTADERDGRRMREMRYCPGRWYPRILLICPGSLIMNWINEMNRWGWWHIDVCHGANKEDVINTARSGLLEIMITTYDTYKSCRSSINIVQWDAVICDECHRVKDRYSETTKALAEVNALCRIGLTGTAIQNKYEELWTILDWTNPGRFGTQAEWWHSITRPLTVGQSHSATVAQLSLARQTAKRLVQNLLPRFFLRRMKTLIAHQLPKKTDRVVFCPLTDVQREAYENFLASPALELLRTVSDMCNHGRKKGWCCMKEVPEGGRWQNIVFPSIITLQKLANHLTLLIPSTTDLEPRHESELRTLQTCMPTRWKTLYENRDQIRNLVNPDFCGKWMILKKLLRFWHSGGDKVLIFSHSVRLLRILQHLFANTSYNVSFLDGSLSYEARQDVVDTFNSDPSQFVFLISTKAGGVGLNITAANKVVIIDPHWNPSYDLQAQDRAYRIGQTRDVEVFRLISLGTVEEIVYARQIYKQQQANIGYTASSERRYFKGVQQDTERKGEIFGLANIFTYHPDSGLLRDIVNKTNIAETKAGVHLVDVDMEKVAEDEENLSLPKREEADDEDGGLGQLAELLKAQNQEKLLESQKSATPKTDAIQAILTSVGVEYTHDNSEVIGTSKVEEQLSRQAAMASYADGDIGGQNTLFADTDEEDESDRLHRLYRPPEGVCLRQFCQMADEFGFDSVTQFALVVENWSQEARRNCLDTFYRRRKAIVAKAARTEQDGDMATRDMGGVAGDIKQGTLPSPPGTRGSVRCEDGRQGHDKQEGIKREDFKRKDLPLDYVKREGIKLEGIDRKIKPENATRRRIKDEEVDGPPKGEHFTRDGMKAENIDKEEGIESVGILREIKREDIKNPKAEDDMAGLKMEYDKSLPVLAQHKSPNVDVKGVIGAGAGTSSKTSIFLPDDDEDDEL
ncbi:SNF2-related protein [Drechmeria coniospora]|uniref:SNF2-related protein n=1 Tax=Drechmeria coniospora TaxID=98403 RepID=A0A151GTR1_DRECN|nr:SNF2-related protein [Drechmeria coniospora]KYK60495.1 SNF2-related protein [Drechmeria coniospora]